MGGFLYQLVDLLALRQRFGQGQNRLCRARQLHLRFVLHVGILGAIFIELSLHPPHAVPCDTEQIQPALDVILFSW